ncbi:MAG: right-handed parallel beta-helix repeat-containing protein, partial [Bacteroidetes bacterium]|nr:right-handed parallel beta-helix repeat-containing protein [Bacteroidota bacterium]
MVDKRIKFTGLFLMLIGLFSFIVTAKTIIVAPKTKITTLKAAIALAKNGDTIIVKKGTYLSYNTIVDKQVIILGKGKPILDAQFKEEVITITADHVKLDGFIIRNSKVGDLRDFAGIRVFQADYVTITNNELIKNFFGIYLSDVHHATVANNKLSGTFTTIKSGNGIQAWKSDNIAIYKNYITGHRDGIYFEFVQHSKVHQNISEKNMRYGLHFMFSSDNEFLYNTFQSNQAGIAVMYSKRIKMMHNHFNENWGSSIYGLLLKEILD